MQSTAMGWLVLRLTDSPFWVGMVAFASQLPAFFVTPFGGLAADRFDRRRMLILTQSLCMLQATLLTILFFTDSLNVAWILTLTVIIGLVNAFDIPIRHSFVLEMVETKDDLGNAIALNSSLFNGARLLGPALAGFLIDHWKREGTCFLVNAVSYIPVILAFWAMRSNGKHVKKFSGNLWEGLKEGFRYVSGVSPIRSILLLICLVCFVPFTVLLPVFAKDVLGGGAQTYGTLLGASGLGAFMGAIYLAARKNARGLGKVIAAGGFLFGLGMVLVAFTQLHSISLLLAVLVGYGMMISMAASNTLLQTMSDDDIRGRVMSFYTMSFMGTAPLGSLLGGYMANTMGISKCYLVFGLLSIAGTAIFAVKLPEFVAQIHAMPGWKKTQDTEEELKRYTELSVATEESNA